MDAPVLSIYLLALCLLAPACPPAPVPPPEPPITVIEAGSMDAQPPASHDAAPTPPQDAAPMPSSDSGPSDPCARACANLGALGCQEGAKFGECLDTCQRANGRLTNLVPECIAAAKTKTAARKCGSVRCLP